MTEEEIREAGAAAVADFPALPDEVAARLGALLADLNQQAKGGVKHGHDQAA